LGSAGDALRRALVLEPQNASARHHLATVLLAKGERDEAVRELERILALQPGHLPALLDLAVLSLSRGEWAAALNRLEVVLHMDPRNQRALFYRAVTLDQLQRREEATEILNALAGEPEGKYAERARNYLKERAGASS